MQKFLKLPIWNEVLVYREKYGWTQYTYILVRINEVGVIIPSKKLSKFPINRVRPFHEEDINQAISTENSGEKKTPNGDNKGKGTKEY